MATGVKDLGNGLGYIYLVDAYGSPVIRSIQNDEQGALSLMTEASGAYNLPSGQAPLGIVYFDTTVTGDSYSALTINGVAQITGTISMVTGEETDAAKQLAQKVNSFRAASGQDYVARASGKFVYLSLRVFTGEVLVGTSVVASTVSGTTVITDTDMSKDIAKTSFYTTNTGFRAFLNADYGTKGYTGGGTALVGDTTNSVEITKDVIFKAQNQVVPVISVTIASGNIELTRTTSVNNLAVNTEGSASTDTLDTIDPATFIDCDLIYIRGVNTGRVVTVTDGNNIHLEGGTSFVTDDKETVLCLQYINGGFYEVSREIGAVGSLTDLRNAGYPFGSQSQTSNTITAKTRKYDFVPNTHTQYQLFTTASNLELEDDIYINFSNLAKEGDFFYLNFILDLNDAEKSIIINRGTADTGGIILSDVQTQNSPLTVIYAYYSEGAWTTSVITGSNNGVATTLYDGTYFENESVTTAKVESDLRQALISFQISGETGELGETKIKVPYDGTLDEIVSHVAKQYDQTIAVSVAINGKTVAVNHAITSAQAIGTTTTTSVAATFKAGSIISILSQNQGTIPTIGLANINLKIDRE
jgi:hypothetical protein